jgi:uncharacterized coiled-coil protein SlyX
MAQQISPDVALPHFRQRCSELNDENILLRARSAELEQQAAEAERRVADLEQQLAETQAEYERLRTAPQMAPQSLSCVEPDALP